MTRAYKGLLKASIWGWRATGWRKPFLLGSMADWRCGGNYKKCEQRSVTGLKWWIIKQQNCLQIHSIFRETVKLMTYCTECYVIKYCMINKYNLDLQSLSLQGIYKSYYLWYLTDIFVNQHSSLLQKLKYQLESCLFTLTFGNTHLFSPPDIFPLFKWNKLVVCTSTKPQWGSWRKSCSWSKRGK